MAELGIKSIGDGWYVVDDGSIRRRVAVATAAEGTWVFVDGHVALVESETSTGRRRATGHQESTVMSPMPATVVSINAATGKTVTEGEIVIVLEAMKMELPIKAPKSGVVKAVHCAKGELVQPGVVLLEIE